MKGAVVNADAARIILALLPVFFLGSVIFMTAARDAASRGQTNGYLIGIFVAFTLPLGPILWLLIRPKKPQQEG